MIVFVFYHNIEPNGSYLFVCCSLHIHLFIMANLTVLIFSFLYSAINSRLIFYVCSLSIFLCGKKPHRGNIMVEKIMPVNPKPQRGEIIFPGLIKEFKNIFVIKIYIKFIQYCQILFPERWCFMMFFLLFDVMYHRVSLWPGIRKCTIPFLPVKSAFYKMIFVDPFGRVSFYDP